MFRFLFVILLVFSETVSALEYAVCHNGTENYVNFLATKTPYRFVANTDDSPLHFDGCTPKKIWMIVRHGTRFPGKGLISDIRDALMGIRDDLTTAYENNQSKLCDNIVEGFQDWVPLVNTKVAKQLAHEGEEEMLALAERFANRLPDLFPQVYSSQYQFRTTDKQRTIDSLRYFLIGLFGKPTANSIWPIEDTINMRVLRFYKECPRWKRDVDDNPLSLLERMKLETSSEWFDMIKRISRRIGLEDPMDQDTLNAMYKTCAFETAWDAKKLSPWCGVFTEDEFANLEFAEDLEYYHIDGYGYMLNFLQACPCVQDLIKHFTEDTGTKTSVSFSHSGTILKLLTHFGLYNETIRHNNLDTNRKWRVGRIDAFGSNIAFVLYKCADEDKFLVLHQERPVYLPNCPKSGLCPLRILMKEHGNSLNNCRFTEMCRIPENNEVY